MRLSITQDTRVLVLTGAGASAESGIPTFRDANGLWEQHPLEEVASPAGFRNDPQMVWRFYSQRRAGVLGATPNPGHHALAALEKRLGDRFLLVTQNVDGLHQRAGSERVIEIHGNILKTRCTRCDRAPFDDHEVYGERVPVCGKCDVTSVLRPHIVWFGESLDSAHLQQIHQFISDAGSNLLFLSVGTSGSVYPAAALVDVVAAEGGTSYLLNLDDAENAGRFDHFVRGRSGEVLPAILAPSDV